MTDQHRTTADSSAEACQSNPMGRSLRRVVGWLHAELGYLDARRLRRHFCFWCNRPTVFEHRGHQAELERLLAQDWRA